VTADRRVSIARRYLLGQASEEECSAVEREYFADETALDRIAGVEDDLVEDYLVGRLPADERNRFERHYLASSEHRTRLEAIRRLSAMPERVRMHSFRYLAVAATLLISVAVLWRVLPRRPESARVLERPPAPAQIERRVFAVSLSPIAVRSDTNSQSVVIPSGTDAVALQLESDSGPSKAANARVVVQTVAGDEVWRGPASSTSDLPAGVIARIDVPASRLSVDDYIVVLLEGDAGNAERERNRYVLRVRSR
jgi:hypothetical protein